jgi:hypothetical protein
MRHIPLSLALLAVIAVGGCATDFPRVDAAMGKSVARMIRAQTLDPQASAHPAALAPAVGDGQRLENVLKARRKDVPQAATQSVKTGQFQTGTQ